MTKNSPYIYLLYAIVMVLVIESSLIIWFTLNLTEYAHLIKCETLLLKSLTKAKDYNNALITCTPNTNTNTNTIDNTLK